jgi:hypothetical protein
MPCGGFEPTIPASEREKTLHALDRSATKTGILNKYGIKYNENCALNCFTGAIILTYVLSTWKVSV